MEISCEIVRDLLPLYHDEVCSEASRRLVEEHLRGCAACRAELAAFDREAPAKNLAEAELLRSTAASWKKNKAAAFFRGALIVAALACLACIVAFNVIGSHIAADGTLVEPFGLIPLAWLFLLLALANGVGLLVTRLCCRRAKRGAN